MGVGGMVVVGGLLDYIVFPRPSPFPLFLCFFRTPPTPHKIKAKSDFMLGQSLDFGF